MDTKEFTSRDFKYYENSVIRYSTGAGSGSGSSRHRSGSASASEFNWKHYCPNVFRKLLEFQNVDYDEYMMSVCEQTTLREVCATKKAGVVITRGDDDQFIIKTLRKSELKVLLTMLPKYYQYISGEYGSNSLLIKLFGLHIVKPSGCPKVYFVVFSNSLLSDLQIHGVYDLKGSMQGRDQNKEIVNEKTIKKDMDLEFCFYLHPSIHKQLLEQLKRDCDFLENAQIMDYSLLLSLHFKALGRGSGDENNLSATSSSTESSSVKLGTKMRARAVRIEKEDEPSTRSSESQDVFLNLGIVDIYQSYTMVKRLEHCYKALHHDSRSISAVNAKAYASRFFDFITKIFASDETAITTSSKQDVP